MAKDWCSEVESFQKSRGGDLEECSATLDGMFKFINEDYFVNPNDVKHALVYVTLSNVLFPLLFYFKNKPIAYRR
uniref:Uncharacterized protein n=1 Tax=Glossina brevipalpis TaxID=37001 RepID=A0A1A9W8X5_9MUSC